MNYLKNLFTQLNPQTQIPEGDFLSFLKTQDKEVRVDFLHSITREKEHISELVDLVSNPQTRTKFAELFDSEELFWAFLRNKVDPEYTSWRWLMLVSAFLSYNDGDVLIETGFFDNGLPSLDEDAPSALTAFLLSRPDYFTWQYFSDAFVESNEVKLSRYGLKEHFYNLVIPNSSGEDFI